MQHTREMQYIAKLIDFLAVEGFSGTMIDSMLAFKGHFTIVIPVGAWASIGLHSLISVVNLVCPDLVLAHSN